MLNPLEQLLVAVAFICPSVGHAAILQWNGGAAGSRNWNAVNHWDAPMGPAIPQAGDALTFPVLPDADAKVCLNDLVADLAFASLAIQDGGYVISGTAFALTDGLSANGGNSEIQCSLSLAGPQTWTVASGASLFVSGGVFGAAGSLLKIGEGELRIAGPSVFSGSVTVSAGALSLESGLPDSAVVVNGGSFAAASPIHSLAASSGLISPGGLNSGMVEVADGLTLNSPASLRIDLTGAVAGAEYDQLSVDGTVTVGGSLQIIVPNSYVPAATDLFVIVENDGTDPIHGAFTDLTEGSVLAAGRLRFRISYSGGTGNDVVLEPLLPASTGVTCVWSGGAHPDRRWTTAANWLGGVVPQPGDALEFPNGPTARLADNNFTAGTVFDSIHVGGSGYALGGFPLLLLHGLRADFTGSSSLDAAVEFGPAATAEISAGTLSLTGVLTSTNGLTKLGAGTLRLAGTAPNAIGRKTDVRAGTLELAKTAGLSAVSGLLDIAAGAAVKLAQANQIPNQALVTVGDLSGASPDTAILEMLGSDRIGPLVIHNASISVAAGQALTVEGDISVAPTNAMSAITGDGELIMRTSATPRHWIVPAGTLEVSTSSASGDELIIGGGGLVVSPSNLSFGSLLVENSTGYFSGGAPNFRFDSAEIRLSNVVFDVQALAGGGILEIAALDGSPVSLLGDILSLTPASTLRFPINGPVRDFDYSSITLMPIITGGTAPDLGGATLDLVTSSSVILPIGEELLILDNGSFDPVLGTFSGLPEGAMLFDAGQTFRISYVGGDGNDVTLVRTTAPPPVITSFSRVTRLGDPPGLETVTTTVLGIAGQPYCLQASTDLVNWASVAEVTANALGVAELSVAEPVDAQRRFYRVEPQ